MLWRLTTTSKAKRYLSIIAKSCPNYLWSPSVSATEETSMFLLQVIPVLRPATWTIQIALFFHCWIWLIVISVLWRIISSPQLQLWISGNLYSRKYFHEYSQNSYLPENLWEFIIYDIHCWKVPFLLYCIANNC